MAEKFNPVCCVCGKPAVVERQLVFVDFEIERPKGREACFGDYSPDFDTVYKSIMYCKKHRYQTHNEGSLKCSEENVQDFVEELQAAVEGGELVGVDRDSSLRYAAMRVVDDLEEFAVKPKKKVSRGKLPDVDPSKA